jgi:hypothetical protein
MTEPTAAESNIDSALQLTVKRSWRKPEPGAVALKKENKKMKTLIALIGAIRARPLNS